MEILLAIVLFATVGILAFMPQILDYVENEGQIREPENIELRPYIDFTVE